MFAFYPPENNKKLSVFHGSYSRNIGPKYFNAWNYGKKSRVNLHNFLNKIILRRLVVQYVARKLQNSKHIMSERKQVHEKKNNVRDVVSSKLLLHLVRANTESIPSFSRQTTQKSQNSFFFLIFKCFTQIYVCLDNLLL